MKKNLKVVEVKKQRPLMLSNRALLAFLALGAIIIAVVVSHAATGAVAFEPENGSLSSAITQVSDPNASAGKAIAFGSGSTGGTITLPNPGTWANITGSLSNELWNFAVAPSGSGIYAGLVSGQQGAGIWVNNSGSTWTRTGSGSGSVNPNTMPMSITFDPTNVSKMWISGIYGSFVGFKTSDAGNTYQQLGNLGTSDWMSIDFSDTARNTMLAGPHETTGQLFKSSNNGTTWTNIAGNLPSNLGFLNEPMVIDSNTYVVDSSWSYLDTNTNPTGIYRTTNGGSSWTKVSSEGVSHHPFRSLRTGTMFYLGTVVYSVTGDHLLRSTDNGLTWTRITGHTFAGVPFELSDGRLVTASDTHFMVSSDNGTTWTNFGPAFPCALDNNLYYGYSPGQNAFFLGNDGCGGGKVWKLQ